MTGRIPMAFLLIFLALCLAAGDGSASEGDCLEGLCDVQMLQLDSAMSSSISSRQHAASDTTKGSKKTLTNCGHIIGDTCDPRANAPCSNNCPIHVHGKDCYRPVPEVMAEHPGEDGYCYFNWTGFWVSPIEDEDPDFEAYAIRGILGLRGSDYKGFHTGPVLTYNFEGQKIVTQMDSSHYSYDDLYGYSLGYLQGQGFEVSMLKNATAFISMVEQRCHMIQETYSFQNEELVLADWLDDNQAIVAKIGCSANQSVAGARKDVLERVNYQSPTNCEGITAREFAKHHYIKCLLGYQNAASDAAYLLVRACLINGTYIGHFTDCPHSPDVAF